MHICIHVCVCVCVCVCVWNINHPEDSIRKPGHASAGGEKREGGGGDGGENAGERMDKEGRSQDAKRAEAVVGLVGSVAQGASMREERHAVKQEHADTYMNVCICVYVCVYQYVCM